MNSSFVLTEIDMIIRLCLGFIAGAIIGFERSSRRQVAGLRTHILISTGATLLMLLSIYVPQQINPERMGDPGRIAAQVVSGMGFLGAGAIIRLGNSIRGLTTAASLWFIAAVGLVIGAGMFTVAGTAVGLGLITLLFLHKIERRIFPTLRFKLLEIFYKDNNSSTKGALEIIRSSGIEVQTMDVDQGSKERGTKLRLLVRVSGKIDIAEVARSIKASGQVKRVEIKEKY
ncbi:MAG: MgtC/SapB family protein [Treponema sp.]|nr:MgtC/SapB family protein [Treponema sp.]